MCGRTLVQVTLQVRKMCGRTMVQVTYRCVNYVGVIWYT